MSVVAPGVRSRSFRTVLGGFDPEGVRGALDAAATEFERLEDEIAHLRQQQADALREIDRIGELERSLLRSCVAAEEEARIRCGAARRYATRLVAAAEDEAAAKLDAPARERDRVTREIETMVRRRRRAAEELERIIAGLERLPETDPGEDAGREPAAAPPPIAPLERRDEPTPLAAPAAATPVAAAPERPGDERGKADLTGVGTNTGADDPGAQAVPDLVAIRRAVPAQRSRYGRLRPALAAGTAAALLLGLQGSSGMPRRDGAATVIAGASFGPGALIATDLPQGQAADVRDGAVADVPMPPPAPSALVLRIKPLRRCWVRVVVDDRTDARELQPGEDIALEAQRSIVLRVGDAGALSMELNGRVLPPLGQNGEVVERRFSAGPAPE